MGNKSEDDGDKGTHRFTPDTSTHDIIDALERNGERNVPTSDIASEIDYTLQGTTKRLRNLSEYVEEKSLGEGNPILWSLRYTRKDFLKALDELGKLSGTEKIASQIGCSEKVAENWLSKLENEGEIVSKRKGNKGQLWTKK
jgi:DNA-binding MarR family transcriptional regulator